VPTLTIAVDAMGGDLAPGAVVEGAIEVARHPGVAVALTGPAAILARELARYSGAASLPITVVDAEEAVGMDETALAGLRRRPRASVRVAADLVARGEAQALFSAGHTGATFLAARAALGVLNGVDRPALAVTIPTRAGEAILLDAGANVECRPEHLVEFGLLGSAYARVALGVERPRVALLSVGEEAGKGTDLVLEAHSRLRETGLAFIGNLDARELFSGRADVIVCDGFTGNIVLKVGEGLVEEIERQLTLTGAAPGDASAPATSFARFQQRVNYAEHGAAPLLGLAGLVLVGHGRSSAQAVARGIETAARLARAGMVSQLADALQP
jgi:phosphate acyltransferase